MAEDWTVVHGDDQPDAAAAVGSQLGRFRLERQLGKGGMGEVFAARDADSGQTVALKTLRNTKMRYRFKREFRALADVEHPNLVRLGELVVPEQGPSFFTMELLDGESFTRAVRGSTPIDQLPDLARLESAFGQLLVGLDCLHANRCVHRDLKPSNVLVTSEGRVVILDFGIVSELEGDQTTEETGLVGTPTYMAPEQAAGAKALPATDLYAVGVMLYECLTGRVPFEGKPMQVLLDKQSAKPPDPRLRVPDVPDRWRELCSRLLQRDPSLRPSIADVLARLESREAARARKVAAAPFVGRAREAALLDQALADVRERRELTVVHVRGASGMGKSTFVEHFLARSGALALRGRCRQRESVPYKGVDAAIDALAVHVRRLPEPERRALRPRYAEALVRVFPVFDEIWTHGEPTELDPHEARGLGWAALREILTRIAERGPLIVAIDDFQWTDHDSVAILSMLARQPDAPALLLLVSARDEVADDSVRAWLETPGIVRVELGPLTQLEARELALALLRAHDDPGRPSLAGQVASRADAVALRCAGSPFFIGQMVLARESSGTSPDLDQIVVDRLAELDARARQLLEIVAVASGPLPQALVIEIAGTDDAERNLAELCRQGLLVRNESETNLVETTHDRIRELAAKGLASERRVSLQWAIGERMWANAGENLGGDEVFVIVDHLAAGLPSVEPLSVERRLELARLHRIAGERAFGSAAWAAARRYFGLGYDLLEPWRSRVAANSSSVPDSSDDARALVLALAFGRAQSEAVAESELADAAFDELLSWPLSASERGQFVARRVALLFSGSRPDRAVDVGLAQLARLGLALPANPSSLRAGLDLLRGWWALGRHELEVLRTLPDLRDPLIRARLDVLAEVAAAAPFARPLLLPTLTGRSLELIRRYGHHVGLARLLAQLALAVSMLGKPRPAAALSDRALALIEHRPTRPLDVVNARMVARFAVWPITRPLRELMVGFEQEFNDACDVGFYFEAGYIAAYTGFYALEVGISLPEMLALFDRMEARNPTMGGSTVKGAITLLRRHCDTLIEGRPPMAQQDLVGAMPMVRYLGRVHEIVAALFFGDHGRATERMDAMPADYPEVFMGIVQLPRYEMFRAVLEARRYVGTRPSPRPALRRIRKSVRVVRRWAEQSPENFGPMVAICEGELEFALGRPDRAIEAFERARTGAMQSGASYLIVLACLRVAGVARDRGQDILADAAFERALDVCEAWGALAVASSLRERGLAGI